MQKLSLAALSLSLSMLVAGCFNPSQPPCSFACGDNGSCPDDYMCLSDGYCHFKGMSGECGYSDAAVVTDGGAPPDLTPAIDIDGGGNLPDLSTPDASVPDMAMTLPDMSMPDLAMPDLTPGPDLMFEHFFIACPTAASYTTAAAPAMIEFGNSVGFHYVLQCLTVSLTGAPAAGVAVTWQAAAGGGEDFGGHPLRGTGPILDTDSGTTATFNFTTPGFYPYYCANHGSPSTSGMAGVVQVVP
jgi:hypothetical protein